MTTRPYFISDRHALYAGWIVGIAMRNGVDVKPVVDNEGNYTDRLRIDDLNIELIVPEPPGDWEPAVMNEHLLYIDAVNDWGADFKLVCQHDSPIWHSYADADGVVSVHEQCWLLGWWENLGTELLSIQFAKDAQPKFPLAVKPNDDWDENGGTIGLEV